MTDSIMLNIPIVRNSEREDFNACPQRWWWRWNLGLVPAMPKQDARWFGTGWHYVWAEHYTPPQGKVRNGFLRSQKDPHETWKEYTQDTFLKIATHPYFTEDDEQEWIDAVSLGHEMIDGQLAEYNSDPGFEVLMPEQRFSYLVPFNSRQIGVAKSHWQRLGYSGGAFGDSGDDNGYINYIANCVGTFDLPIRDHTDGLGTISILDWKTTNRRNNMKQMNKDNQFGTYIAVATNYLREAELIKPDEFVERGIISFARKGKADKRPKNEIGQFLNKDGTVSKLQGAPLFWREVIRRNTSNRLRQISRIADDVEAMQAVRSGMMPLTKSPGDHCNWCDFSDLCDIDEDGGDTANYIKDVFKMEDPYADHREGAINSKSSVT